MTLEKCYKCPHNFQCEGWSAEFLEKWGQITQGHLSLFLQKLGRTLVTECPQKPNSFIREDIAMKIMDWGLTKWYNMASQTRSSLVRKLPPIWHQAITSISGDLLSMGHLFQWNFNQDYKNPFMHLKMSVGWSSFRIGWALVQIMACRLFGAKPLLKPCCLLSIRSGDNAKFPPQPPGSLVMRGTEWPKCNIVI